MMRAAVIGVGDMGRNHARVYNELKSVELVAVADANVERAEDVARLYKVPFYTDYAQMIEKEDVDLISVAVPTRLHREVVLNAVKRGVHLLVEKPIAYKLNEAHEIVQACGDAGLNLMIGHIERFNPAVVRLKSMISELGQPISASATRVGPLPRKVRNIGIIVDLGVHDIDLLRYLFDSEVSRLYCEMGRIVQKTDNDFGKIVLKMKNDVAASIDVNWLTPVKTRRLIVQGLEAMFEVDYIRQALYRYEVSYAGEFTDFSDILLGMTEGEMRKIPVEKEEPLKVELEKFVESVERGKPPPVTGEDGLKALEIALLAEESGRTHKVIEL